MARPLPFIINGAKLHKHFTLSDFCSLWYESFVNQRNQKAFCQQSKKKLNNVENTRSIVLGWLIHMHVRLVPVLVLHYKIFHANPVFTNMPLPISPCIYKTLPLSVLYVMSAYFYWLHYRPLCRLVVSPPVSHSDCLPAD